MTIQLTPAVAAGLAPKIPTTKLPTVFPPSFLDTVELEFHKMLDRDHPTLNINFNTTWLSLFEYKARKIPPFTNFPTRRPTLPTQWIRKVTQSLSLRDSLIDFFLGSLVLKEDSAGLFVAANSVAPAHEVTALNFQQLHALYAELATTLADAYDQSLLSYWGVIESAGKTRTSLFMDERARALRMLAQAGMDQKNLTAQQGSMLDEMLQYSQTYSPAAIKQHGVFSLALAGDDYPQLNFAGVFVISHACTPSASLTETVQSGPVLLYSPNNGLEGFDSFLLLAESLSKRMADPVQRKWFLENAPLESAAAVASTNQTNTTAHDWGFAPIEGDFLSVQFLAQIAKQQADFAHCVKTSRAQGLKSSAFLEALSKSLDPRYQFDNYLNLDWNDRYILHTSMPNWWQAMSVEKKDLWLISAKSLAHTIVEINQLTVDKLINPLLQDQTLAGDYLATVIQEALTQKHSSLSADEITIDVTYTPPLLPPFAPGLALPPSAKNNVYTRYSLQSLAAEKPSTLKLSSAHSIVVTDKNKARIDHIDEPFVRGLMARIDNSATIDSFLATRLKTSEYATSLHDLALRLSRTQLQLGLLSLGEAIPTLCQNWIKAVVNAPQATADRQVKNKKILVKFLSIYGVPLSNVLKIGPQVDGDEGVVFCTLNAPDGIVFRWFAGMDAAKTLFLTNPDFAHYLLIQIPADKRPLAAKGLKLDQWLNHRHLPDVFELFPSPVPLPGVIWDPVSFVDQTRDFLDESHGIKIQYLLNDATTNLLNARELKSDEHHTSLHLAISIFLLFLPPPTSIPVALGLALYNAWNGFRYVEQHDYAGAAKELLLALDYLVSAGVSKLALARGATLPIKLFRSNPRPLTRRIGGDGDVHISILSGTSTITASGYEETDIVFDALRYHRIEIDKEVFYIRSNANLFGHMTLYRRYPEDARELIQRGEFALLGNDGQWVKAPYQVQGVSPKIYEQARVELGQLTTEWPKSVDALTTAQRQRFESDYLSLATSNAYSFPEVLAYCEGGSAEINDALRAGIETEETLAFRQEFYQLHEYHGLAYRAAYVTTLGLEQLQGKVGIIFADKGIQSASVSPLNALRWAADDYVRQSAGPGTHSIFLIFDSSVPKKNMFTEFLGDHVGIAPDTPLQLMAFKHIDNVNYAYFSAPEQVPNGYFDIFTGQQVPLR
ncbi:hypothetical protein RHM65_02895 [Pseudomonas sp. CCI4.2]|uniref:hypothetical protein n=1 Tax=Pseudomonas sp. CCI4.2 TaxID=3048620 RepID=UPI002AC903F7|nr:hypothetical protein [Pseudomonas sp. CCI4.2]MEB0093587.1 hypothetical protein [Pseudomonas sp. CCI4.2]WPX54544.1 hypothetical protein RHM65_02895 [Pseudomonas sp. CCI4.2]